MVFAWRPAGPPPGIWNVARISSRHVMCLLEQLLSTLACSNQVMDTKPENPGMWINPKSNLTGGGHSSEYGEGQVPTTHDFWNWRTLFCLKINEPTTKPRRHPSRIPKSSPHTLPRNLY